VGVVNVVMPAGLRRPAVAGDATPQTSGAVHIVDPNLYLGGRRCGTRWEKAQNMPFNLRSSTAKVKANEETPGHQFLPPEPILVVPPDRRPQIGLRLHASQGQFAKRSSSHFCQILLARFRTRRRDLSQGLGVGQIRPPCSRAKRKGKRPMFRAATIAATPWPGRTETSTSRLQIPICRRTQERQDGHVSPWWRTNRPFDLKMVVIAGLQLLEHHPPPGIGDQPGHRSFHIDYARKRMRFLATRFEHMPLGGDLNRYPAHSCPPARLRVGHHLLGPPPPTGWVEDVIPPS